MVIAGTNGKTTTSNLIADAVAASGAVVCNRAGNNMEPGVVGRVARGAQWPQAVRRQARGRF